MTVTTITPGLFQPQPWQDDALCAQTDPELFFPNTNEEAQEAKRICASCEALGQCLRWAIDTNQKHGIWGGTTLRERNKIAKGKPLAPAASVKKFSRNQTIVQLHDKGISVSTLAEKFGLGEVSIRRIIARAKVQRANQHLKTQPSAS